MNIPELSWLTDTYDGETPPDYLPFSGAVLELSFAQEVELDPSLFSFATQSGRSVPFSLEYAHDITSTGSQDNKKKVLLVVNDTLTPGTSYVFTVRASINPSLKGDMTYTYLTAPKLGLRVGEVLNNRQVCLISNLPLSTGE